VVFRDRAAGREIEYPELKDAKGQPLRLEDVEAVAGSGAVSFNRRRFGDDAVDAAKAGESARTSRRKRK
jgi:hypothetical protein